MIARATRRPSTAALIMPPAYPAPSPQGYNPASWADSKVSSRFSRTGAAGAGLKAREDGFRRGVARDLALVGAQARPQGIGQLPGQQSSQIRSHNAPVIGRLHPADVQLAFALQKALHVLSRGRIRPAPAACSVGFGLQLPLERQWPCAGRPQNPQLPR